MKTSVVYDEFRSDLTYKRETLRWNGWGSYEEDFFKKENLPEILRFLRNEIKVSDSVFMPSVPLEEISLPPSRLTSKDVAAFEKIVGKEGVRQTRLERILHSAGRSYYDVLRLQRNLLKSFVDGVVYPRTSGEVAKVLEYSASHKITIIPYGGGSSVVGGLEVLSSSSNPRVVSLDTTRLNRLINLNEENLTARFEAGIYGPHLERELNSRGFTLGHFPQSFVYSTLGGWVAARSAGQQSNRYGKIEEMISGLKLVTPGGTLETGIYPAHSSGPDWNQIVAGSEGLLGVITEVNLKIHKLPEKRLYFGLLFPEFKMGIDFIREVNQSQIPTSMLRLSDEEETRVFRILGSIGKKGFLHFLKTNLQERILSFYKLSDKPSALIVGLEGTEPSVLESYLAIREMAARHKGLYVGEGPGRNWVKNRFNLPFLRNHLMEYGVGIDTMETSTTYDKLDSLRTDFHIEVRKQIPDSISFCHISHSYWNGACLYFTVIFKNNTAKPVEEWKRLKKRVSDLFFSYGASASHHHGIGTDHKFWYEKEKGRLALEGLKSLKSAVDKTRIMNPGKVFD